MRYISTRDTSAAPERIRSAEAIKRGLAPDGGLYLPEYIPHTDIEFIRSLTDLDYSQAAAKLLSLYLDDYTAEELEEDCRAAYGKNNFFHEPAPVECVGDGVYCLELWHGPTCAFKDMALQLMPRLLSRALKKTGEQRKALVLVATSGDTGKAALEGYKDVPGVEIKVFYPDKGVSRVQKLQMMTQSGSNVDVCAIDGNFDDAQTGVKKIFANDIMVDVLNGHGYFLSSANSINWGRLVPQIVYYYVGYVKLVKLKAIRLGEKIDVTVPTGNFGNIFAAYLAMRMGLPIRRLVCASNSNNILTDLLTTGVYDLRRQFITTMSPSMDILISSNLERLLYLMTDAATTKDLMQQLDVYRMYTLPSSAFENIKQIFRGYYASESDTADTIRRYYANERYLCDPHTAVGLSCAGNYITERGQDDKTPILVASTASPYKFAGDVLAAISDGYKTDDAFAALDELCERTACPVPAPLAELKRRRVIYTRVIKASNMKTDLIMHLHL